MVGPPARLAVAAHAAQQLRRTQLAYAFDQPQQRRALQPRKLAPDLGQRCAGRREFTEQYLINAGTVDQRDIHHPGCAACGHLRLRPVRRRAERHHLGGLIQLAGPEHQCIRRDAPATRKGPRKIQSFKMDLQPFDGIETMIAFGPLFAARAAERRLEAGEIADPLFGALDIRG
jgi:hypothetical protein